QVPLGLPLQFVAAIVELRQAVCLHLQADELRPVMVGRATVLLEPVGVDEAAAVALGVVHDGLQQRLAVHLPSLLFADACLAGGLDCPAFPGRLQAWLPYTMLYGARRCTEWLHNSGSASSLGQWRRSRMPSAISRPYAVSIASSPICTRMHATARPRRFRLP